MRKSLFSACSFFLLAALLVPAPAMAYSFVGTWRATIVVNGRYAYDSLVLEGDGNFNELLRSGTLMTEQTGEWRIVHGLLYLNVEDWQPKVQCLQTGCFPIRKPPGSLYRVQWLSANVIRCQDVNLGGYVIYRRA
jgi:hypothetical protein